VAALTLSARSESSSQGRKQGLRCSYVHLLGDLVFQVGRQGLNLHIHPALEGPSRHFPIAVVAGNELPSPWACRSGRRLGGRASNQSASSRHGALPSGLPKSSTKHHGVSRVSVVLHLKTQRETDRRAAAATSDAPNRRPQPVGITGTVLLTLPGARAGWYGRHGVQSAPLPPNKSSRGPSLCGRPPSLAASSALPRQTPPG
jgi:hypothetical protein